MFDVYDTLRADTDNFDTAKEKFSTHSNPTELTQYRVYEFRKAEQLSCETLDAFVTCEFTIMDNEIKAQITRKCRSSNVRRRSFQDGITLKEVLDYGRVMETAEQEASVIEATTKESVNKVYIRKHTKPFSVRPKTTITHDTICSNCGGIYPHKR